MIELLHDCELRIGALEHHLRISPVQGTPVKPNTFLSRSCPGLKFDGTGNSKKLEESLKANSTGLAGAGSACSTALYDVQSRMNTGSTSDDLQSSSTTVRGHSGCESSAIINAEDLSDMLGQEEKAEAAKASKLPRKHWVRKRKQKLAKASQRPRV